MLKPPSSLLSSPLSSLSYQAVFMELMCLEIESKGVSLVRRTSLEVLFPMVSSEASWSDFLRECVGDTVGEVMGDPLADPQGDLDEAIRSASH
jgi:hypothetical protein